MQRAMPSLSFVSNITTMIKLIHAFRKACLIKQILWSTVALISYFATSSILTASYTASKFPVPYFMQQTSFDAVKMKAWYSFMIHAETFDIYLTTQFIDFAFIVTVIIAGFTIWTTVANLFPEQSFFRRWGYRLAFALPLAGLFDIVENLVSFTMIANPTNFPGWLMLPYSGFACLKFAAWVVALAWLLIMMASLPVVYLYLANKSRGAIADTK